MFQRKNPGGNFGNKKEGLGKPLSVLQVFEKMFSEKCILENGFNKR